MVNAFIIDWMFMPSSHGVPHLNSYAEIRILSVMMLGHEISTVIDRKLSSSLSTSWGHWKWWQSSIWKNTLMRFSPGWYPFQPLELSEINFCFLQGNQWLVLCDSSLKRLRWYFGFAEHNCILLSSSMTFLLSLFGDQMWVPSSWVVDCNGSFYVNLARSWYTVLWTPM